MFASLAIYAGVVKGQCDMPFDTVILNTFDATVGPLYCSLPTPELKNFFEFAVDNAFAVDPPPTYDFVKTCFPGVLRSFEAYSQQLEPICTASQTAIASYASISNGIKEALLSYGTIFCIDADCDLTNLNSTLGLSSSEKMMLLMGEHWRQKDTLLLRFLFQPLSVFTALQQEC